MLNILGDKRTAYFYSHHARDCLPNRFAQTSTCPSYSCKTLYDAQNNFACCGVVCHVQMAQSRWPFRDHCWHQNGRSRWYRILYNKQKIFFLVDLLNHTLLVLQTFVEILIKLLSQCSIWWDFQYTCSCSWIIWSLHERLACQLYFYAWYYFL